MAHPCQPGEPAKVRWTLSSFGMVVRASEPSHITHALQAFFLCGFLCWASKKVQNIPMFSMIYGGQRGIRTLETVPRLHTFQACAFDHSATCPLRGV